MAEVGTAEVPIFPTFRGFRSAVVTEVESSADQATQSFGDRFRGTVGGAMRGVGVAVGATLAVGMAGAGALVATALSRGLDRALNLQDARAQLDGLGHSAESVDNIMSNALDSVRGTAFGLDAAATTAAGAVAAGIAPGDALRRTLTLTADAATIARTSMGEMGSIINKVATSGRLTTDVLNQFHDRGVPLLQMVATEYGVTAEAAQEMVTNGEVSFERFQSALEANVGGAALTSGETARGAFANVQSALGRLGAMFTGGAVSGAPGLFQSISAAIDRAATALGPLAERFNAWLVPAMASLAAWIDTIDFSKVVAGVQGLYDLLVGGDFTGALRDAFGWEEDAGFVVFVLNARDALTGLYDLVVNGDFTGALQRAFGMEEDSGFVTFVLGARDAITGLVSSLSGGDIGGAMGSIGTSLATLTPAFSAFGEQLPSIGGAIGTLASAGLTVLTGALSFLADNVDTIIAFMPLIVGGFVAWRIASAATTSSMMGLQAAQLLMTPVTLTNTILRRQAALAELAVATASGTSTAATSAGMFATLRQTAATVASRVAMVAGAVATGIAAGAQWALNAAMSANPIALVVIAIAALVAGLIWFFTQTELGQEIWANFTRFLGEAWANVSAWFMAVGEGIALWWTGFWQGISDWFSSIWTGLVAFLIAYVTTLQTIIAGALAFISEVWNGAWAAIGEFISTAWDNIVTGVSTGIENVISFVTGIPDRILSALGDLGSLLFGSGQALIDGFIGGIQDMIGGVQNVVGGVMDTVAGFFPNSPAKRGPFSGSGWTKLHRSGGATFDQWLGGMDPSGMDDLMRMPSGAASRGVTGPGGGPFEARVGGPFTRELAAQMLSMLRATGAAADETTVRHLEAALYGEAVMRP